MKDLRIGMIGYGFMGKAHSNAYQKVNHFFDLKTKPVLQALCARDQENATSFANNWGYASVESDWRARSIGTISTQSIFVFPIISTRRSPSQPPKLENGFCVKNRSP